jgi:hypothetical protein
MGGVSVDQRPVAVNFAAAERLCLEGLQRITPFSIGPQRPPHQAAGAAGPWAAQAVGDIDCQIKSWQGTGTRRW